MARIMIENLFKKTLEVSDLSRTLLSHLHHQGIDWMHACGGKRARIYVHGCRSKRGADRIQAAVQQTEPCGHEQRRNGGKSQVTRDVH